MIENNNPAKMNMFKPRLSKTVIFLLRVMQFSQDHLLFHAVTLGGTQSRAILVKSMVGLDR